LPISYNRTTRARQGIAQDLHPAVALLSSGVPLDVLGEATERRPIFSSSEIMMIRLKVTHSLATRLNPLIQGACSSVSRARFTIQQTCSMGGRSISSADENARTPNSADCNRLASGSRLVRRVTQRNALHGHYCRRRRGRCQLYVGID
jgi:hypothetical protein